MELFCTSERNNTHILLPVPLHRASVLSAVYKLLATKESDRNNSGPFFIKSFFVQSPLFKDNF